MIAGCDQPRVAPSQGGSALAGLPGPASGIGFAAMACRKRRSRCPQPGLRDAGSAMSRRPKSAANVTCVLRRLACLALASSLLVAAPQLSAQPRLLLAGGHLPVCSSAAPSACKPGAVPQAPVASTRRYRLDDAGIARVAARGWLAQRSAARDRILAALRHWHRRAGEVDVDPERLARKLDAHEPERGVGAWSALAEFERERVLDALEREPLRERIDLAASLAQSGVPVYREFVAMARAVSGREAPHVLIGAASGRDPFESIDYYRAVFEQAEPRCAGCRSTMRCVRRRTILSAIARASMNCVASAWVGRARPRAAVPGTCRRVGRSVP